MIKTTPVQKSDFDQKAFRLLDALNEKGRAEEAWELDILEKGQKSNESKACFLHFPLPSLWTPVSLLAFLCGLLFDWRLASFCKIRSKEFNGNVSRIGNAICTPCLKRSMRRPTRR